MDKNILKKSLITGTVFLFLSTSCFPFVSASEGKPDLIIEDIFLDGKMLWENSFYCTVRNIGNSPVSSFANYEIKVEVYWLLFRCIPLIQVKSYIDSNSGWSGSLFSDKTISFSFLSDSDLPHFGYYRILLTINPNNFRLVKR